MRLIVVTIFLDELFDAGSRAFKNPHDQLSFLTDSLRAESRDFFLVFHNIDGVNLRKEKTQQVCLKAVHPSYHVRS